MTALLAVSAVAATIVEGLRWLRVAQREHYLPVVSRFAIRWWRSSPVNAGLGLASVVALVLTPLSPWLGIVAMAAAAGGPVGLGLSGRTSRLAWTSRLKATAVVFGVLALAVIAVGAVVGAPIVVAAAVVAAPGLVDLALVLWRPLQARRDTVWVERATEGLARSGAEIVAITGSYGKTTTKGYIAHLLADRTSVVASPASFNNRMGLARSVNENVGTGTEVFVAEMGTYGIGEIREMCSWIRPRVGVLTALGPVHLERMKTLEKIAIAKREIFERADVAVIAIDHPLLAAVASEEAARRRVITVSVEDRSADVHGDPVSGAITAGGSEVGRVDPAAIQVSNAACAVAAVEALGIPLDGLAERLSSLPTPPHRQVVTRSEAGFAIIDDTYNSNPAGAARALELLSSTEAGRRVVVTPGMVELGPLQDSENEAFARAAAEVADDVVVVGRTNRHSLRRGVESAGAASVHFAATRSEAVDWVRRHLGPGDAVLYENDLPDHYP